MTPFGIVLERLRLAAGLSRAEVADRSRLTEKHLSRLITGRRHPSREAVGCLSQSLGLDPVGQELVLMSAGYLPESEQGRTPTLASLVRDVAGVA